MSAQCPSVETIFIPPQRGLDAVEVFVTLYEEHAARITVVCYDKAWTACFMSMGKPWRSFLAGASVDYLANALGRGEFRTRKQDAAWLDRIAASVKKAMQDGAK